MVSVCISSDMQNPDIALSGAWGETSPTQPVTQKPDHPLLDVGFRPHVVLPVGIQQAESGPRVHLLVGAYVEMLVHLSAEEKEVRMTKDEVAGEVAGWSKEQLVAIRRLVSNVADAGVCVKM